MTTSIIDHQINPSARSRLIQAGSFIGNTPLFEFASLGQKGRVRIFGKMEWQQLSGSVKARAAYNIIQQTIFSGNFQSGMHLLDASSGNTGIAYGAIAAGIGVPLTLCLPENASVVRKQILKALGVNIIYTDPFSGTDGAQAAASALKAAYPNHYYYLDQYNHPANAQAHQDTTAYEIWRQTHGQITHFITGIGTGGSFTGTGLGLKQKNPSIQLIALQPDSPLHGMEGWKHLETARVPGVYDTQLADQTWAIQTEESYEMIRFIARHEGVLLSPSSAANLVGAVRLSKEIPFGTIVTLLPDNAEKYPEILSHLN